ncbi:MAG TPA: hypothetical protein VFM18_05535, partial [Methanosarcina sp.]|nr:hypothetical protein [Methanosarcina sp.]
TKDLWVSQKMITNTGNLVQNTLQPVNTLPYHMMLSDKGYNHNPAKTFLLASADTLGGMAQHYGNKLGITKTSHAMTELGREATKYAEDNFILDLSPFDEHQSIEKAYVPGVTEAAKVAREVNQITNKSANFAAFMSFVHHLDQSGKFKTRTELFKEAEHWMNASMVDPRPGERPFMVQDTGSVGSLTYGLQSYVLNKYNTLAGFIDHGVKSGSVKGWAPFATALTADIALAGVKGFIPLATYMAIADAINSNTEEDWLPDPRKALMEIGDSVGNKVGEVAGEKAGQFASDVMATGAPGAAVGLIPGSKAMDLGPRFASLPSVPGLGMAMDIGRQVGDVATGLTNAVKGDERGLWQAANAVAPVGLIKGSTEALGPFSNPKTMDTNVRTLESTGYKRDDTDKLFKAIGIPSLAENKAKDQSYQFNRLNKIDRERALKIADRFANNIVTGRPVSEGDVAMLVKKYPDVAQALLTSEVNKKAMQWNVDAETLHAIQLNTLSKIERYKEVYGTKR